MEDPLAQAEAHCKELQLEYRRLVTESTRLKMEEYSKAKDYGRLVEERSGWESKLAEDEVEALMLAEELKARCSIPVKFASYQLFHDQLLK